MSDTQEQNKDVAAEAPQKTQWGLIIQDMVILMVVMGLIGYLCNLLMKPFEKTYPTDSVISIILKAGVKDGKDDVFAKELAEGLKTEGFINIGDRSGRTPLMWAVYANFNNPEEAAKKDEPRCFYVDQLLKVPGIDPNLADHDGFTALHWAAWSGLTKCCAKLITDGKLDVNAKDSYGYTPLMLAALRGNVQVVQLLLENGADNTLRNADGKTASDLSLSFESAYSCRGSWMYQLIYSKEREAAYQQTVDLLVNHKTPEAAPAAEEPAPAASEEQKKIDANETEAQEEATEPTTLTPVAE